MARHKRIMQGRKIAPGLLRFVACMNDPFYSALADYHFDGGRSNISQGAGGAVSNASLIDSAAAGVIGLPSALPGGIHQNNQRLRRAKEDFNDAQVRNRS